MLYFFMINEVVLEIYVQPNFAELMTNFDLLLRYLFLVLEFFVFAATLIGNFLFLAVRMIQPNQINLIRIEPKKQ